MIPFTEHHRQANAAEQQLNDLTALQIEQQKVQQLQSRLNQGDYEAVLQEMMQETEITDFHYFNKLKHDHDLEGKKKKKKVGDDDGDGDKRDTQRKDEENIHRNSNTNNNSNNGNSSSKNNTKKSHYDPTDIDLTKFSSLTNNEVSVLEIVYLPLKATLQTRV